MEPVKTSESEVEILIGPDGRHVAAGIGQGSVSVIRYFSDLFIEELAKGNPIEIQFDENGNPISTTVHTTAHK